MNASRSRYNLDNDGHFIRPSTHVPKRTLGPNIKNFKQFKIEVKKLFSRVDVFRLHAVYNEYVANKDLREGFDNLFKTGKISNAEYKEWLYDIVGDERQCIAFFEGKTGLGKSTAAQQVSFDLHTLRGCPATIFHINIDDPNDTFTQGDATRGFLKTNIIYSHAQALESITHLTGRGDSTVMDEYQPPHGPESGKLEDKLRTVVESVTRAGERDFFCCTPREHEFPDIDAYFDVIGKSPERRETLAIIRIPAEKTKDKSPAVNIVVFKITQSDEQMKWYKGHSKAVKDGIAAAEGSSGAGGLSEQKLEHYAAALHAKLDGIPEGKYKQFIMETNEKTGAFKHINLITDRIDEITVLSDKQIKAVIDYAFFSWNPPPEPSEEVVDDIEFPFIFPELRDYFNVYQSRKIKTKSNTTPTGPTAEELKLIDSFKAEGFDVDLPTAWAFLADSLGNKWITSMDRMRKRSERNKERHTRDAKIETLDLCWPIRELSWSPTEIEHERLLESINLRLAGGPQTLEQNQNTGPVPERPNQDGFLGSRFNSSEPFDLNVEMALDDYAASGPDDAKHADMYRFYMSVGLTEADRALVEQLRQESPQFKASGDITQPVVKTLIERKYGKPISQQDVSKYVKKVSLWLYADGLGGQYEEWCYDWYCKHKEAPGDEVIHDGAPGHPDIIIHRASGKMIFVACKASSTDAREKNFMTMPVAGKENKPYDLKAEIEAGQVRLVEMPGTRANDDVEVITDFYTILNHQRQFYQVADFNEIARRPVLFVTGL